MGENDESVLPEKYEQNLNMWQPRGLLDEADDEVETEELVVNDLWGVMVVLDTLAHFHDDEVDIHLNDCHQAQVSIAQFGLDEMEYRVILQVVINIMPIDEVVVDAIVDDTEGLPHDDEVRGGPVCLENAMPEKQLPVGADEVGLDI